MPRAPRYNQSELVSLLEAEGFKEKGRGNHGIKMVKTGIQRPIIVPNYHGEKLPVSLSKDILKQAGIDG